MNDKLLDELDGLQALLFARAHGSSLYEETLREWGLRSANYWADIRAHITELEARNSKLDTLAKLAVAELGRLANQNDDGTVDTVELMGAKMRLTAALEALEDGE